MQGYICKRKKILIAENELIGDFLPFYYQVLYILYDFKAKVNIQRVEKRQQRQQQGKVEEQIGNRFALKAYAILSPIVILRRWAT